MNIGNLMQQAAQHLRFLLVCAVVIALIIFAAKMAEKKLLKDSLIKVNSTKYTAICGMLGALATVLMLLEFPVPFLALQFYKLDFSELPVMVGGFFLGPVGAVLIELVKILLKLLIKSTTTAFVGDFANFVIGCALVVPASIVYHTHKTKNRARAGLLLGTVIMAVFGSMFNAVYLLPEFSVMYGCPLDQIVAMGTALNSNINSVTTLVLFSVFPLNIIKGGLVSVLTMLLYKRISIFFHTMLAGEKVRKAAR